MMINVDFSKSGTITIDSCGSNVSQHIYSKENAIKLLEQYFTPKFAKTIYANRPNEWKLKERTYSLAQVKVNSGFYKTNFNCGTLYVYSDGIGKVKVLERSYIGPINESLLFNYEFIEAKGYLQFKESEQ